MNKKIEPVTKAQIQKQETHELAEDIRSKLKLGQVSEAVLSTDEKVLARVTDGIYRQPASALRELISNAYDADAETVSIDTDAPRFENIVVRDDGNGMSIEALTNLIHHIGGSVKRSSRSDVKGITNPEDPTLSPVKKRKLIGKIGIGLFSVAQLTREFTIVTKQTGSDFYLIAEVVLNNYSEQQLNEYEKRGQSFETGFVKIKTEPADQLDSHGTDIILRNIKRSARDQLKSVGIWLQESAEIDQSHNGELTPVEAPKFHIGCIHSDNESVIHKKESLPWTNSDAPREKFVKLYQAMIERSATTVSPKIELDLDNYLNMLWTLSLSVPVDYIEKHPLLLSGSDYEEVHVINNAPKGKVRTISLEKNQTIKEALDLMTPTDKTDFNVVIDEIQLFRPLRLNNLPSTQAAVKHPILFIGSASPDTSKIGAALSGGDLSFEAYILWCPKVVPKEHNGVLIRIHNSTGVLFDASFMKYQVAEHVIKGQLSIEIFINEGMDSALNIDRESFNVSHPHYQIVMRWLHNALRQVIAKFKDIRKAALGERKEEDGREFDARISSLIRDVAIRVRKEMEDVRTVQVLHSDEKPKIGFFQVEKSALSEWYSSKDKNQEIPQNVLKKFKALVQVLDSFDLIDGLSDQKQKELFRAIVKVLGIED
ncbi:ATP-binding protein [Limnobacter sp. SAORIC-690]|uniref:ATP-binding protein n=2 Tax=Limnobacter TaxID=131079 RepID=UPI0008EB57A1|nr:ATP-binding protein [Limnobacter sp. SAORIC-690]PQJ24561.1 ATP-binding protein [Limnobacter sp. SAORIC-690]SMG62148.1 protein containing ATP-binding region, ATPase-like domain [methanotrophic bacterial endosymbiont of Bathymodiolus sp.]